MFITCLIPVMFYVGKVAFLQHDQVTGVVKVKSEVNYIGDFSIEASSKGYFGDYSKVLVNKNKCIETNVDLK